MSGFDNLTSGLYKNERGYFSIKTDEKGLRPLGGILRSLGRSNNFSWCKGTHDYTLYFHMPKEGTTTEFLVPLEFLS